MTVSISPSALAAFLAGALDLDLDRATSLTDAAIEQAAAAPEPRPMSEQQIAVAALGALHPGDVVVEGYRPEPVPIGDGHGFVTVRREIPESLPTVPGYYVAKSPSYGERVVVELLNSPAGQWVDAHDRNYLDDAEVQAIAPLVRLMRAGHRGDPELRRLLYEEQQRVAADVLRQVGLIELRDADARADMRRGIAAIAAPYRIEVPA